MNIVKNQIDLTVQWLHQKVSNAGCKGLVVGISGGIDSALCAFLIKKTFPNNSLGLILPCGSNSQDKLDALKVADKCGIKKIEIELSQTHEGLNQQIQKALLDHGYSEELNSHIAKANLKARLRMSTIYSFANSLNYLVVGTDNAAELYTGYFTKYGDGGVDLLPIANLTKNEVRLWAKELGVPSEIINKTPSAGLWENQSDEQELGTTYDMIDKFLQGEAIPEKDKSIIENLHRCSEHKRKMPPIAPKI